MSRCICRCCTARRTRKEFNSRKATIRRQLLALGRNICPVCDRPVQIRHPDTRRWAPIHHRIPIADGGTNDLANLTFVCPECHWGEHPAKQDARLQIRLPAGLLRAWKLAANDEGLTASAFARAAVRDAIQQAKQPDQLRLDLAL